MSPVRKVEPDTNPDTYFEEVETSFISVAELGNYIGRDLSNDPGGTICVDAACEMVRTLSGQTFNLVHGDVVVLDGTGTDALVLPELPVLGAGTVVVNGTAAGTADYALAEDGVLLALSGTATWFGCFPYGSAGGPWNTAGGAVWPKGRQNISVTYDHGYAGTAGGTAIPADVRMVALSIASRLAIQGPAIQENIGQSGIRYGVNSTDLTNGEKMILQKYRGR